MRNFKSDGFVMVEGALPVDQVRDTLSDVKGVFGRQFVHLGYPAGGTFEENIFRMFREDLVRYKGVSRTVQHLRSVYELGNSPHVYAILRSLGLSSPIICQKPNINICCKNLAVSPEYYIYPPHQDFRATQGSVNGLTVYVPLVNVDPEIGALQVVRGSHLSGLVPTGESVSDKSQSGAIRAIGIDHNQSINMLSADIGDDAAWESVNMRQGDALFFSTFLLHRSGVNVLDKVRWAMVVRYNDLDDPFFEERGFPNPYKMVHENTLGDEDFADQVRGVYVS